MDFSPTVGLSALGLGLGCCPLLSRLGYKLGMPETEEELERKKPLYNEVKKAIEAKGIVVGDFVEHPELLGELSADERKQIVQTKKEAGPVWSPAYKYGEHELSESIHMPKDLEDPNILAHEYGHGQFLRNFGHTANNLGWLSDLGPIRHSWKISTVLNSILAATGNAYKTMGGIAAANAVLNAPGILREGLSSYYGNKVLEDKGVSLLGRLPSYGAVVNRAHRVLAPLLPIVVRAIYDKYK